ncbi:GSCFA domain-containing protein [Ferruginibacter albus]|uniref:GSCFA domain-containing protein n=1 Tax=Ferruginibacter albus TaxID=2875540 RepID=UPI001CC4E7FB|nr:GSCFA domain-containing protein [Ferruginibacter albus]UAY51037.1 GSCFA domain-containing protein [Ferruginibacter albus]
MDFHLEFSPKAFETKIIHQHKLLLIGSCFTENIGTKLRQHKFSVLENPNGILFNPVSIAKALTSYVEDKRFSEADLFYQNEVWNSWQHHSRFSHTQKEEALQLINNSQKEAHDFLKEADWCLITLGSAFVYEIIEQKEVAANCHKIPLDKFNKKLLTVEDVLSALDNVMHRLFIFNPKMKIIFTISPVRHLRDGFIENNRSKAVLIQAVHHLVNKFAKLFYFPAYELVIDDLRDYRFYAEDMVHPNYAATNYVWEKFVNACIDEPSQQLMKEINIINAAKNHKAFNPLSEQHKKFLKTNLEKVKKLKKEYPYINFKEEELFFQE